MNKHTTLPNLMQKLVSDEEIQLIAEAVGYRDSSRTFTLRELIHFFLLAAIINGKAFATEPMWGLCMDCRDSIIQLYPRKRKKFPMTS